MDFLQEKKRAVNAWNGFLDYVRKSDKTNGISKEFTENKLCADNLLNMVKYFGEFVRTFGEEIFLVIEHAGTKIGLIFISKKFSNVVPVREIRYTNESHFELIEIEYKYE
jgi:hypothetical protein